MEHSEKNNFCPVCGFDLPWDLEEASFEICPSCGIQFGYHDAAGGDEEKLREIYRTWRKKRIEGGMKWKHNDEFSLKLKPDDWNPEEQLKNVPEEFK